jgi:hypothetical protein
LRFWLLGGAPCHQAEGRRNSEKDTISISKHVFHKLKGGTIHRNTVPTRASFGFAILVFWLAFFGRWQLPILISDAAGNNDNCVALLAVPHAISGMQKEALEISRASSASLRSIHLVT